MELLYQLPLGLIFIMTVLWITQRKNIQKNYGISPVMLMLIMTAIGILFLYIPHYLIVFTQDSTADMADGFSAVIKAIFMGILEIPGTLPWRWNMSLPR